MSKPKLCIVANDIFGPEWLNSGGHRHFLRCIDYWSAEFDVTLQAPRDVHGVLRAEFPHVALVPTTFGTLFANSRPVGTVVRALGAFSVPAADVYYSSSQYLPNLIGPAWRRLLRLRRRLVVVVHHLIQRERRASAGALSTLALLVERAGLALMKVAATHVFFISREGGAELAARGFTQDRLTESTNSVSNRCLVRDRTSSRAVEVVYVGNISVRKGALDLLRAWAIVHEAVPTASLLFIGQLDPSFTAAFARRIAEIGSSVSVRSDYDDAQVAERFARARVFATASYEEGWGIVVAEAMYAGLAVVTYDLPAYRTVFGAARRIAPVGDVAGLAREIVLLLSDDAARRRLVEEADQIFRQKDWCEIAELERRFFS